MTKAIDIEAALAGLTFLENRTRFSDTAGTFARLAEYRDSAIFAGGFSGVSQWERHPNGDEIVQEGNLKGGEGGPTPHEIFLDQFDNQGGSRQLNFVRIDLRPGFYSRQHTTI